MSEKGLCDSRRKAAGFSCRRVAPMTRAPRSVSLKTAGLPTGARSLEAVAGCAGMRIEQAGRAVALVTGSTSGIGKSIARRLAADGMRVVVHSRRSAEAGEALAAELDGAYLRADSSRSHAPTGKPPRQPHRASEPSPHPPRTSTGSPERSTPGPPATAPLQRLRVAPRPPRRQPDVPRPQPCPGLRLRPRRSRPHPRASRRRELASAKTAWRNGFQLEGHVRGLLVALAGDRPSRPQRTVALMLDPSPRSSAPSIRQDIVLHQSDTRPIVWTNSDWPLGRWLRYLNCFPSGSGTGHI
ncbi:hypothetical protein J2W56_006718 [Nocardia kruczakiae]|uniref:Short subunit dehydrogenase n=1 Tax=Nocardia kruczakiae TaxID=261477 RepID=A0ABU1XSS9_9NOCA|nr:SDR family NAD(P)-dependent oxidoreductase [Nocardia kruczakiae]MDR7172952.1 hypothetical protein [Nocardia kruczakiae]